MQNRFISSAILTGVLMSCASAQPAASPNPQAARPAQQAARPNQATARPATIGGHPNFNGMWQALNTAYWNLEAHNAQGLDDFWGLGAIAAIPAGKSVVKEGTIPYLPAALAQREKNRLEWPASDPEAKCYMLGVPRVTYHDMPFQIFQGNGDLAMVYPFEATNRIIYMNDKTELPVESWMGKSYGSWEGPTLVIKTTDQNDKTWLDRAGNFHSKELKVTERFTLIDSTHIRYSATMDDPKTYSKPWTIEMVLYRIIDEGAQLLEHKCVPFADKLLYSDLMHLTPQQSHPISPRDADKQADRR
jgi:hypothetical protein